MRPVISDYKWRLITCSMITLNDFHCSISKWPSMSTNVRCRNLLCNHSIPSNRHRLSNQFPENFSFRIFRQSSISSKACEAGENMPTLRTTLMTRLYCTRLLLTRRRGSDCWSPPWSWGWFDWLRGFEARPSWPRSGLARPRGAFRPLGWPWLSRNVPQSC